MAVYGVQWTHSIFILENMKSVISIGEKIEIAYKLFSYMILIFVLIYSDFRENA